MEGDLVTIYVPTTPNPTGGYMIFVPRSEVVELDMTVEDAWKMIISVGIVTPPDRLQRLARPKQTDGGVPLEKIEERA
jgi:uncharacterized membrane protein